MKKLAITTLAIIFFSTILFSACRDDNSSLIPPPSKKEVDGGSQSKEDNPLVGTKWKLIGQGNIYSDNSLAEQYSVIKNTVDWLNFIAVMDALRDVSSTFTDTNIDFSQFSIIAVIDEVKTNGGWSIDVTNVIENSDNITITIENLYKGNVACVMTQPFQIVKIPVSNKKIIFNKQLTRY